MTPQRVEEPWGPSEDPKPEKEADSLGLTGPGGERKWHRFCGEYGYTANRPEAAGCINHFLSF